MRGELMVTSVNLRVPVVKADSLSRLDFPCAEYFLLQSVYFVDEVVLVR